VIIFWELRLYYVDEKVRLTRVEISRYDCVNYDKEKRMEKHEGSLNDLYLEIITSYKKTKSIKQTAELLDTYPIKIRRVLITEGLWESETSRSIGKLFRERKLRWHQKSMVLVVWQSMPKNILLNIPH
jgi:hypothetical protein